MSLKLDCIKYMFLVNLKVGSCVHTLPRGSVAPSAALASWLGLDPLTPGCSNCWDRPHVQGTGSKSRWVVAQGVLGPHPAGLLRCWGSGGGLILCLWAL